MDPRFAEAAAGELQKMREQGLLREEWPILGPQGPEIRVEGRAIHARRDELHAHCPLRGRQRMVGQRSD